MGIEIRLRLRIELNDLLWRQYPLFMRKSGIGKKARARAKQCAWQSTRNRANRPDDLRDVTNTSAQIRRQRETLARCGSYKF